MHPRGCKIDVSPAAISKVMSPDSRFAVRHYYRKSALFDRLLKFAVKMDFAEVARH